MTKQMQLLVTSKAGKGKYDTYNDFLEALRQAEKEYKLESEYTDTLYVSKLTYEICFEYYMTNINKLDIYQIEILEKANGEYEDSFTLSRYDDSFEAVRIKVKQGLEKPLFTPTKTSKMQLAKKVQKELKVLNGQPSIHCDCLLVMYPKNREITTHDLWFALKQRAERYFEGQTVSDAKIYYHYMYTLGHNKATIVWNPQLQMFVVSSTEAEPTKLTTEASFSLQVDAFNQVIQQQNA